MGAAGRVDAPAGADAVEVGWGDAGVGQDGEGSVGDGLGVAAAVVDEALGADDDVGVSGGNVDDGDHGAGHGGVEDEPRHGGS